MGNLIRKALRNIYLVLCHTFMLYVCLCRLTSSGKSEHVFIQKIIKSLNKKKTFCACIAQHKRISRTHSRKVHHEDDAKASRTPSRARIFDKAQNFCSFTTFSFSSLISYQLDLVSSRSEVKSDPGNYLNLNNLIKIIKRFK
jgi:hypothetical protein